jgi:bifunctional DNase/RNase
MPDEEEKHNKDGDSKREHDLRDEIYASEPENIDRPREVEAAEVRVVGVFEITDHEETHLPFVVLRDSRGRTLHIQIGYFEGAAISLALQPAEHVRPMTHDLMKALVQRLGGSIERVLVDDLWQGTYYAKLLLTRNGEPVELDCRPSDAIAIGLRFSAPIYVAEKILVAGDVSEGDGPDPEEL